MDKLNISLASFSFVLSIGGRILCIFLSFSISTLYWSWWQAKMALPFHERAYAVRKTSKRKYMDKRVLRVPCDSPIQHEAVRIIDSIIQSRGMMSLTKLSCSKILISRLEQFFFHLNFWSSFNGFGRIFIHIFFFKFCTKNLPTMTFSSKQIIHFFCRCKIISWLPSTSFTVYFKPLKTCIF